MAWRPQRDGGVTASRPRQVSRLVYEDFQPQIDTNEEEGARVVVLRVPGFLKEQMRITYEPGNKVRVQGQRPLMNYRWSRFNLLLPVPENCDTTKIQAKVQGGNLTITMPKEVWKETSIVPSDVEKPAEKATSFGPPKVEKPAERAKSLIPSTVEKPAEKATEADIQKHVPPKVSETKVVPSPSFESDQRAAAAAELREQKGREQKPRKPASEEKVEKGERKTRPPVTLTADKDEKQRDEKKATPSLSSEKEIVEPKRQKGTAEEEVSAKQRVIFDEGRAPSLAHRRKYTSEPKSLRSREETLKRREDETIRRAHERLSEPEKAQRTVTRAVGKLNNEDRKLLINIGAAVLVIVALGAYVSYTFRSASKREN